MNTLPKGARKIFRDRSIGERFHTGKYHGMGARSHVLNYEVIEKRDNKSGVVVECHGDRHTVGQGRAFNWMAFTFDL